jgi:hypothetical protein
VSTSRALRYAPESGMGGSGCSVPAPEAAALAPSPADGGGAVYDHIHDSSFEFSALQGFYGNSRGVVVKFCGSLAAGAASAITATCT